MFSLGGRGCERIRKKWLILCHWCNNDNGDGTMTRVSHRSLFANGGRLTKTDEPTATRAHCQKQGRTHTPTQLYFWAGHAWSPPDSRVCIFTCSNQEELITVTHKERLRAQKHELNTTLHTQTSTQYDTRQKGTPMYQQQPKQHTRKHS